MTTDNVVEREVRWEACYDRRASDFPHLMPELEEQGRCNSSHGGSCCVCDGRLPDLHIHLNAEGDSPDHVGMGGNVCSEGCMGLFVKWIREGPSIHDICPGHWRPLKIWDSTRCRQALSVRLKNVGADPPP